MAFKTKKTEMMKPYVSSDVGLKDEDSGLRLFRGMSSPWGAIKDFKETFEFMNRHGAEFAVATMHSMRIIIPDYERCQTLLSDNWAQFMDGAWDPEAGQIEEFEDRFDVPPFLKDGQIRAAIYADKGDAQTLIPGKIWYTTNDRFEKEIHRCDYDIAGPECCDLSLGGGSHFCYGLAGCPLNAFDTERIGNGDNYCVAIQETKRKYGKHPNSNEEDEFDTENYEWEGYGPAVGKTREKGWPKKQDVEFFKTGYFESPTGAKWTAGEMFRDSVEGYPLAYSYNAIDVIRNELSNDEEKIAEAVIPAMFEACGKFQFADWNTRKATRDWMNVPASIDDGRVMGSFISMIMQSRAIDSNFFKFDEEETIVEVDMTKLGMMGMYPEINQWYQYLFNGNVKTLVGANWSVDLEEDLETNKARYIIHKVAVGFRRQKPNLGPNNYDKD